MSKAQLVVQENSAALWALDRILLGCPRRPGVIYGAPVHTRGGLLLRIGRKGQYARLHVPLDHPLVVLLAGAFVEVVVGPGVRPGREFQFLSARRAVDHTRRGVMASRVLFPALAGLSLSASQARCPILIGTFEAKDPYLFGREKREERAIRGCRRTPKGLFRSLRRGRERRLSGLPSSPPCRGT